MTRHARTDTAKALRKRARHNGEGSIRQRPDGTWEGRYTAGVSPIGKQIRKSVYGRTRTEAAGKLKVALTTHGPLSASTPVTLTEYLGRLAAQRVGHVSPRTSEIDGHWIKYVQGHPTGSVHVQKLRTAHLEDLYRHLAASKSRSVVMHVRTFINMALRQAVRHDLIVAHPGVAADLPRMAQPVVAQAITSEQVEQLFKEAKAGTGRWYPLIYFAVSLGLRHGELLGLQWGDIDEAAGEVSIRRAASADEHGRPRITSPKTRHSARTLYLAPQHFTLLTALRETQPPGTPWIFSTYDGQPLRQTNVRREFIAILDRAGLPRIRIHDLRHTFATHLIGEGHDVKTVSSLMGHKDSRMTLEIYTHAQESLKKRAALEAARLGEGQPEPRRGKTGVKPAPK